jgi:cell division protein FtsI/penicillin-binding protein 2
MLEYNASSASLIIMEPQTGAIRVMCNIPDFDPNNYGSVDDISVYNNSSIFTAYEPGSIFKPVTMAAALDEGLIDPHSPFHDFGVRADLCKTPIRNAELKIYNDTDMTGILENSINTGMIYISERLGTERFRNYVEKFGFGIKSGITLDTESAGNIVSLSQNKKTDKIDCYTATASFGQGLTVTPLQMVDAYAAIANGGTLMTPYIVDEIQYKNGKTVKTQPVEIRRVMSERAASLLSGMLVNVVEKGHAVRARSTEYYIAGKTGTAQIPGPGGYTAETIHSFVGFAPVDNPKFVMIVKYEKPERKYAESTAVPVFGDIAKFIFDYYEVIPGRK